MNINGFSSPMAERFCVALDSGVALISSYITPEVTDIAEKVVIIALLVLTLGQVLREQPPAIRRKTVALLGGAAGLIKLILTKEFMTSRVALPERFKAALEKVALADFICKAAAEAPEGCMADGRCYIPGPIILMTAMGGLAGACLTQLEPMRRRIILLYGSAHVVAAMIATDVIRLPIPEGLRVAREGGAADVACYIAPPVVGYVTMMVALPVIQRAIPRQEQEGRGGALFLLAVATGAAAAITSMKVQAVAVAIAENNNCTGNYKIAVKSTGVIAGLFMGSSIVMLMKTTVQVIRTLRGGAAPEELLPVAEERRLA